MNLAKRYPSLTLAVIQVASYGLICYNLRAVAQARYIPSVTSDFFIASINFFVIRRIALEPDNIRLWLGYVVGSMVGTALGIYLS